jgi:threonine dehydrogenase-like Zn-dependent dehydrogenase
MPADVGRVLDLTVTALAAVATSPRHTEIRELPIPEIAPDAGLLRVEATGVCGSDWPMYQTEAPGPRILGHEMVGIVERLGPLARERWGVEEGDVVALEEYLPCGHCEYCRSGEFRSCLATDSRIPGAIRYGSTPLSKAPSLWGGFSQYLYMHPRTVLHRVPPGVPVHIAAMAIPLGNGFQWAYLDGGAGPGQTVVVQGPGQTGLACVIAARAAGAERIIVSGLSRDQRRFEVARQLGADVTVAVDQQDLAQTVAELTDGRMADLVIEATNAGTEIINSTLALVRKRGTLLLASRKGAAVPQFDLDRMLGMQMTVKGVRGHSYASVEMALNAMAAKKIPLELLSTDSVGLNGVDQALRTIGGETGHEAIHITISPWQD